MDPRIAFFVQFLWFLVAWSAVAVLFVVPRLRPVDVHQALAVWVSPNLFRVLGLGLLVPNLSPGMPASFAVATAIGDAATALLALASLVALARRWRRARALVWVFNTVGSLDAVLAGLHAASVGAALHLAAQWYVPVLAGPLMVVAHVMVFHTLVTRRKEMG